MFGTREILRGATRRFAPAAAATILLLDTLFRAAAGWPPGWLQSLPVVGIYLAMLTTGYVAALGVLRPSLRADADVAGRRATVAGVASCGLVIAGLAALRPELIGSVSRTAGVYAASAFLTTAGLFLPWLRRQRPTPALGRSRGLVAGAGQPSGMPAASGNPALPDVELK